MESEIGPKRNPLSDSAFNGCALAICATLTVSLGPFWRTFEILNILDKTLKPESTRKELVKAGFSPIQIYRETETVTGEGASGGIHITLDVELALEVLVRENGDWTNNVLQGLGRGSAQYRAAINFGRITTRTKIKPSADRRLELSGHSLGGGLASAVCAYLTKLFPKVYFHAIVFNPAGVHPNTIKPATAADGNIDVFSVNDEILTTVQSHRDLLPVIGAIFRLAKRTIGQDGMPEHLGNMMRIPGASPGKYDEKWSVPPKGSPLPLLFPVNRQTLVTPPKQGGFPELTKLDSMLSGSPSVSLFATQLLLNLNERYRKGADEILKPKSWFGIYRVDTLYVEMIERYWSELKPEIDAMMKIIEASVSYHGMDYVIATYEKTFGGL